MQIIEKSDQQNGLSSGGAFLIPDSTPDFLIGRLCTLIEVAGLNPSQEKSIKDLLRQEVWAMVENGQGRYVCESLNDVICSVFRQLSQTTAEGPITYTLTADILEPAVSNYKK